MLLLCGRKPACSLRGIECFPVPLGRRLTKFQGSDLLAHLEWYSCTCRNLSEVLGGRQAEYSSKRVTARQALLLKAWGGICVLRAKTEFIEFIEAVSSPEQALPAYCLTHRWWGLQLLGLSGSAWSCSVVCSWKVAFRLWPWFCAVCTEWGLYDGTSQGRHCTMGANNGEITLIAYSIEVVNQNQQLCHPQFPWIQKLKKN